MCNSCSMEYCITFGTTPSLECLLCGQGVHEDCFKSATQSAPIPTLKGLHWLCSHCEDRASLVENNNTSSIPSQNTDVDPPYPSTEENPDVKPPELQDVVGEDRVPVTTDSNTSLSTLSTETTSATIQSETADADEVGIIQINNDPPSSNQAKFVNETICHSSSATTPNTILPNPSQQLRKICYHYENNKCRFGLSGRGCPYLHPKPCRQFIAYGSRHRWGCNRGQKCNFFHPKVCRSSSDYSECYNLECSLWHLKGTKRYPEFPITTPQNNPQQPRPRIPTLVEEVNKRSYTSDNQVHPLWSTINQNAYSDARRQNPPAHHDNTPSDTGKENNHFLVLLQEIRQQLKCVESAQQSQAHTIRNMINNHTEPQYYNQQKVPSHLQVPVFNQQKNPIIHPQSQPLNHQLLPNHNPSLNHHAMVTTTPPPQIIHHQPQLNQAPHAQHQAVTNLEVMPNQIHRPQAHQPQMYWGRQ